MGWLFSRWGIWALRPSMSAKEHREMREKVAPLYRGLIQGWKQGEDYLFYDAPLAMIFTSEGDPTDAVIAATYAMVAAESLGLGSCMIGTVTPMIMSMSKAFRRRHGLEAATRHGLALVFGHPQAHFRRAVRRRFAGLVRNTG
jgi:nitroreductase